MIQNIVSQESPEFAEEYIDEELPESSHDPEVGATPKPNNSSNDVNPNKKSTNFAEDRFTKLFTPRKNRPLPSPLFPKFASKPKPTLPSFIKNTQPLIRVQPTQAPAPQQQRFNQRATQPTQRTTTTRTPSRQNAASNRRNQITNNRSGGASTPASQTSTTESPSRRRYGSGNNRRFNTNSTIPATIRPKRN